MWFLKTLKLVHPKLMILTSLNLVCAIKSNNKVVRKRFPIFGFSIYGTKSVVDTRPLSSFFDSGQEMNGEKLVSNSPFIDFWHKTEGD